MKLRMFLIAAAVTLATQIIWRHEPKKEVPASAESTWPLPSEEDARQTLNSTERHREWVSLPVGAASVRVFVAYPGRMNAAPVVVMTARNESASARIRAMALRMADQGYIAVVPDFLSGMAPHGGDSDSFADDHAVATALNAMDPEEFSRRLNAARAYATTLPSANGRSATLDLDTGRGQISTLVDKPLARKSSAEFPMTTNGWRKALRFLALQTNNNPVMGVNPNVPEDHSMHMGSPGMLMAQTPDTKKGGPGRGGPFVKTPDIPATQFNSRTTVLDSKLRKEFVDIPYGNIKLHTWVEYPGGEAKAPIVIVMQHGPGMDDWQRALADQLALQGFIAIAADLHSGLGPNGGAYESFRGTDEVMRATARINQDEMQNRYRAALAWGKQLPRWNGKIAAIGFCMGGGNAFRFAGEVPEVNAVVSFYGNNPSEALMAKIKAPVLAFYGEEDARVTAGAEPAKAAMEKLGKNFEYHIYPHATHGFLEFQDLAGNPAATADSWPRTIDFLKKNTM